MSGSNSTSTPPDVATPAPTPTTPSSPPANTSPPPVPTSESTTAPPTPPTSLSTTGPPTPSSTVPSTSSTSSSIPSTTSASTTSSRGPSVITSVITKTPTAPGEPTSTIVVTSTELPTTTSATRSSTSSSASNTASLIPSSGQNSGSGLSGGGLIAVAVVVPIVAVALLILGGLFLWRKRKQRKDAEELRRKEVEEYGYNPNNDPSLPPVGGAVGGVNDGPYEMKEDGSSGYRGWGTTAVASSGRKASTTMSGPSANGIGMAYSDASPNHGAISDTRSDNPMLDGRAMSPESEVLGAMGPSAANNRGADINRGPSNASSSYSAANRSDASGEGPPYPVGYGNQYDTGNPYAADTPYGSPPNRAEMSGQPIIRDVQARRNTRIENPSHFPQQSAGISQNF